MSIKSISSINGSDKKRNRMQTGKVNSAAIGNKPAILCNPKNHNTNYKPAIATTSNKPKKTLIINHLHTTPTATTSKKPAKPEM